MTAVPLPPIVPLADLVAELRAMHSIPCLTAADRLEEMARENEALGHEADLALGDLKRLDALRPWCPTCNGSSPKACNSTRPEECTGDNCDCPLTCPDCVDGHVTWRRLVNVFARVWKFADEERHQHGGEYGEGWRACIDHLRAVR